MDAPRSLRGAILLVGAVGLLVTPAVAESGQTESDVTFTKDVLPIFQRSCQKCHRPGTAAPMSAPVL